MHYTDGLRLLYTANGTGLRWPGYSIAAHCMNCMRKGYDAAMCIGRKTAQCMDCEVNMQFSGLL